MLGEALFISVLEDKGMKITETCDWTLNLFIK